MPPSSSLEPGTPTPEQERSAAAPEPVPVDPNAPLSFVPHDQPGDAPRIEPIRIRTGRYGEMDEHELIHLLDSIEDERARGRFRESVYISCFIWMVLVWVAFYGPKYLWHAPRVVNPMDVLRERSLTQLNLPRFTPVPRPAPPPKVDTNTLEHLRETARERAARAPEPPPPAPTPAPTPAATAPVLPPPTTPTPNVRTPPPVVAEAPTPQPATKPNFNTVPTNAGDAIRNALNSAAHDRGSGNYPTSRGSNNPLNMGGAEILSDTQGVNFNPYIQRILRDIKRNWDPLIPEEANPPLSKQGETYISFSILPDGTIGGMNLDGSTHDDAINKSCWGSITSEGQFPPLPSAFKGPKLELRIHFLVNKQVE